MNIYVYIVVCVLLFVFWRVLDFRTGWMVVLLVPIVALGAFLFTQ